MVWLLAYVVSIVAANVVTAHYGALALGALQIPWGTLLIGCTLVLRDAVQLRYGRKASYAAIGAALAASAISSRMIGDPLAITAASAVAFAFSESAETEIFSRFKALLAKRIFWSGTISSLLDSAIFIVLGLSPVSTGFIPWPAVPLAILGQYVVKTAMVSLGSAASLRVNQRLLVPA